MSRLPVELYRNVIQFIRDTPTLLSLLLVNTALKYEAERVIYHSIYRWEVGDEMLAKLIESPKLSSLVHSISFSLTSTSQLRIDRVASVLRLLTNLKKLTLAAEGNNINPLPLFEGCTFQLVYIRITGMKWADPLCSFLYPYNRLLTLEIDLVDGHSAGGGDQQPPPVFRIESVRNLLREAIHLSELNIHSRRYRAYHHHHHHPTTSSSGPIFSLSELLKGCTFRLKLLSCKEFPPDINLVDFLDTQHDIETLCIQTKPGDWPVLASTLRHLSHLKMLKLYSHSGNLDIHHLLGATFQLRFIRLVCFPGDPDLSTFLESQPGTTTLCDHYHPIDSHLRFPNLTNIYAETQQLVKMHDQWEIKPLQLYWMRRSSLYMAQVEVIAKVVGQLKSLAIAWRISPNALLELARHMPLLKYLGLSAELCKMDEIIQVVEQLPKLEVLRIINDHQYHHSTLAQRLFSIQTTSLRRIAILEEVENAMWTRSFSRKNWMVGGVAVPEPNGGDVLIREFRDRKWVDGLG